MIRLPKQICMRIGIHPDTEFDALFRMPVMRLGLIFHKLSKKKTEHVSISVKDNGWVPTVCFIKDMLPPDLISEQDGESVSSDDANLFKLLVRSSDNAEKDEDAYRPFTGNSTSSDDDDFYKFPGSSSHNAENDEDPNRIIIMGRNSTLSDDEEYFKEFKFPGSSSHDAEKDDEEEDDDNDDGDDGNDDANDEIEDEEPYKYQISCSHNAENVKLRSKATSIDLRREVKTCLCMCCLHDHIISYTEAFQTATSIIMCLGPQSVIIFRDRQMNFSWYLPPLANHTHHSKSTWAFVRDESVRVFVDGEDEINAAAEGGNEDGMDAANEQGDQNGMDTANEGGGGDEDRVDAEVAEDETDSAVGYAANEGGNGNDAEEDGQED